MFYREFSIHYLRLNAFKCKFIPTVCFSKITAHVPQSSVIGWLNEERFSSAVIEGLPTRPKGVAGNDRYAVDAAMGGTVGTRAD